MNSDTSGTMRVCVEERDRRMRTLASKKSIPGKQKY